MLSANPQLTWMRADTMGVDGASLVPTTDLADLEVER